MVNPLLFFSRKFFYFSSLLFFLGIFSLQAQNTSNKGKDFWVAYTGHIDGVQAMPNNQPKMYLYLTSDVAATATITIGTGTPVTYPIQANAVTPVPIDFTQAYVGTSEVIENKGIHVTSDKDIVVYSHIFRSARSSATIVLPTNTVGREYYSLNYTQSTGANNYSQFTIIGTEDNTVVEITPSKATRAPGNKPANVPFKVTLNAGQVYQVQSTIDLTGSRITTNVPENTTCKKIAVFSGSTWTAFGCSGASGGDNLYQQLYPVSTWGNNFVTAPLINRPHDIFRIFVAENNTTVSVNGSTTTANGTPLTNPYAKGSVIEFTSSIASVITASKSISVAQYEISQTCDPRNNGSTGNAPYPGDPDMIILNPVEQTVTSTTLYSALRNQTNPPTNITQHFINVVMKTADVSSFKIDGNKPAANFLPIAGTEYSYLQEDVTNSSAVNPTHNLTATAGFNAIAYGYGAVESYIYSAGANVKDLTKFITPQPLAGLQYTTGCENVLVNFKLTLPYNPTSLIWDFGDGTTFTETDLTRRVSPDHVYTTKGTYVIKATIGKPVSNDCDTEDELTFNFDVQPNPKAEFKVTDFCAKNVTTFEDLSVPATGTALAKWEWNYGDGSPVFSTTDAAAKSPNHMYLNPGDYRVRLKIITTGGCTDTISQKITIFPLPKPAFTTTPVCDTKPVVFTNSSTILSGTIAKYEWNFGDKTSPDNSSAEINPGHVYTKPGIYSVLLKAFSDKGCVDSVRQSVTIYPKPKAAFELPGICFNDRVKFTNSSTIETVAGIPDAENKPLTYFWEFGNGTTSTLAEPSPVYTAVGFYRVKLRVTSKFGCVDTISAKYVVSSAEPKADFIAADFCQKDSVQFTDKSFIDFGNIIKWEWTFGDGGTSDEQNPKHLYAASGTYSVTLKAYSGQTCFDVNTKSVTIIPSPTAIFKVANVCLKEPAVFTQESTMLQGITITGYAWDFGDGSKSTERDPKYVFQKSGTYTVKLTVTAANGCTDQTTRQIIIYPEPVADFKATSFCQKDAVEFKNSSSVSSGTLVKYVWDFGDGGTATQPDVNHQYAKAGAYRVTLTVTTNFGCTNTTEQTIIISAVPQASAGQDQVGLCGVTSYVLQGNNPPAGLGTWTVVSGTGGSFSNINQYNATFTGKMSEPYTLRWTVKNEPCPDATSEVKIKFNPIPKVEAGTAPVLIDGESTTLNGSGEGTYSWSPATGLSSPTIANPEATPVKTTVYKLTVTSIDGCTATDSVLVKVLEKLRPPNAFSPNNDGINDTWKIGGVQDYPLLTIEVFDRWGSKIYSGGYDKAWDGTRDGKPLPMATYYYIINPNNGRKILSGPISIIR